MVGDSVNTRSGIACSDTLTYHSFKVKKLPSYIILALLIGFYVYIWEILLAYFLILFCFWLIFTSGEFIYNWIERILDKEV